MIGNAAAGITALGLRASGSCVVSAAAADYVAAPLRKLICFNDMRFLYTYTGSPSKERHRKPQHCAVLLAQGVQRFRSDCAGRIHHLVLVDAGSDEHALDARGRGPSNVVLQRVANGKDLLRARAQRGQARLVDLREHWGRRMPCAACNSKRAPPAAPKLLTSGLGLPISCTVPPIAS